MVSGLLWECVLGSALIGCLGTRGLPTSVKAACEAHALLSTPRKAPWKLFSQPALRAFSVAARDVLQEGGGQFPVP